MTAMKPRNKQRRRLTLPFVAISMWCFTTANAQLLEPDAQAFSFQAKLTGVNDGQHELRISLYDANNKPVGTPTIVTASITNGIISEQVALSDVSVFDEGRRLWAEVSVDDDPPLSPRIPLIAVPYSLRVHRVGSLELDDNLTLGGTSAAGSLQLYDDQGAVVITLLGSGDPAVDVAGTLRMEGIIVDAAAEPGHVLTSDSSGRGTWQPLPPASGYWTANGNDVYRLTGNIGIGTSTPAHTFHSVSSSERTVFAENSATAGTAYGGYFQSASTGGTGVVGLATAASGFTFGVIGRSDSVLGRGVEGIATESTGENYGGRFTAASDAGRGVAGIATSLSGETYGGRFSAASSEGQGVYGETTALEGDTYGVYGYSASSSGTGVLGRADATTGATNGVKGINSSVHGRGVSGVATASTGFTIGVYGQADSTDGIGVFGWATDLVDSGAIGVYGQSESSRGRGVYGLGAARTGINYGVFGESLSESGRGVFGRAMADANSGSSTGVHGQTWSSSHFTAGVLGEAMGDSGQGAGVMGKCQSTEGRAVEGVALGGTGVTYGGHFRSFSNEGCGVFGEASASSGQTYGVYGRTESSSDFAVGVLGEVGCNCGGYGVLGRNPSLEGVGVHGEGGLIGVLGTVTSTTGAGVFSFGDFGATGTKSFVQPHPSDPSKEIRFVSLEGNESGTYFRGSSQLIAGRAVIEVPEEFRLASESDGLTVQVSAMGPNAALWVESKDLNRIVVRGTGDVEFDYFVNGVRRGFADLNIIRENRSYVPQVRGVLYGTQYRADQRRILVENGILNPDFTPNEETAARLGWRLSDSLQHAEQMEESDSSLEPR